MADQPEADVVAEAKAEAASPVAPAAAAGPMVQVEPVDRKIIAAIARHLVNHDPNFTDVVAVMLASRQLYAVAVHDLELRMSAMDPKRREQIARDAIKEMEKDESGEVVTETPLAELFELVEEVLIQSSAYQASKEFDEKMLLAGMSQTVVPWLPKATEFHNLVAAQQQQQMIEAAEQARRAKDIPLGIRHDDSEGGQPRTRSLVFYGWKPALLWVLDKITTNVLAYSEDHLFQVIRLSSVLPKTPLPSEQLKRLFRVGETAWRDCCKSSQSWAVLFQRLILPQLSDPPDVLIVDDLSVAGSSTGMVGGTSERKAGNSHKRLMDWCKKAGCGLLGGIPLDSKEPTQPIGSSWEQLRVHSTLRCVYVTENDDTYKIFVGNGVLVDTVKKEVLDDMFRPKLILE